MRHRHGYRKLGKDSAHRKSLLKNLSISLITTKKLETTVPKAKELRRYVEKLITKARVGDSNSHKVIFSYLQNKVATNKLIEEIAPDYKDRTGGYTRITKTRIRRGDAAPMAYIELV